MKMVNVGYPKAKSKDAALNQIVAFLQYSEHNSKKEANLMDDKIKAEEKLNKIQKHLEEIETRIVVLSESTTFWNQEIQRLKDEFKISETEILALRSKLIKEKLSQLEKLANIQVSGSELVP